MERPVVHGGEPHGNSGTAAGQDGEPYSPMRSESFDHALVEGSMLRVR